MVLVQEGACICCHVQAFGKCHCSVPDCHFLWRDPVSWQVYYICLFYSLFSIEIHVNDELAISTGHTLNSISLKVRHETVKKNFDHQAYGDSNLNFNYKE